MKVSKRRGIYICVVSLFTGFLTMARSKPVSAVSEPAPTSTTTTTTTTSSSKQDGSVTPPNCNSRSEISPLSKAMEALDIRPFSLGNNAINLDMSDSRCGSNIRSKVVEEETTLEDMIVGLILNGQWEVLEPNSGKSIVLGNGKSVSVSYQEEQGSGYRTWEWHGHVMVYEDGEGYVPEYVYGNYFEPLEDQFEPDFSGINSISSADPRLGLGRYISGLGFVL